jgi:hypothetical protein
LQPVVCAYLQAGALHWHPKVPSQEYLRARFDFNAATGDLLHKVHRKPDRIGTPTSTTSGGYAKVAFTYQGKLKIFAVHRVIWVMHHGQIPTGLQIDHIDRNPLNYKLSNLRLVSYRENNLNKLRPLLHPNQNIIFSEKYQRWEVRSHKDCKRVYVGYFKTEEEARAARDKAHNERELFNLPPSLQGKVVQLHPKKTA